MKRSKVIVAVLTLLMFLTACTVDQVLADINVLIQIAASIGAAVGTVSPGDSAEIQKLSGIATAGVSAIQAAYASYKASGAATDLQKLQAAINAVQTNLSAELAAAHITNPASQQKITNWVNLIYSTLAAIVAAIPQLQAGKKAASLKVDITPKTLKARWDSEVCGGDTVCSSLVVAR